MKSAITSILLLCTFSICKAQVLPALPTINSNTSRSNSQSFIQQYLDDPAMDGRPSSYIFNTGVIANYFQNLPESTMSYFHVYFAIDPTDISSTVQLVIVPSIPVYPPIVGGPILMHDTDYDSAFVPCQNSNMLSTYFYTPDNLDPSSVEIPATATTLTVTASPVLKSVVTDWIANYQNTFDNTTGNLYIQSFSFNAQKLRAFLTNTVNVVPYLQVYLGKNQKLNANLNQENYTLIFMGLDASGNHIPVNSTSIVTVLGSRPMSFEACRPCPECGIEWEDGFDDQLQALPTVFAQDLVSMNNPVYLRQRDLFNAHLYDYEKNLNGVRTATKPPVGKKVKPQLACKAAKVKRMQNKHVRAHKRYKKRIEKKWPKRYGKQHPIKK